MVEEPVWSLKCVTLHGFTEELAKFGDDGIRSEYRELETRKELFVGTVGVPAGVGSEGTGDLLLLELSLLNAPEHHQSVKPLPWAWLIGGACS